MIAQSDQQQAAAGQFIGYGRVSTDDQNLELQLDALQRAGCRKIYTDKMSGATAKRPALYKALARMKAGDTLVIWKLSRLGRSVIDLARIALLLKKKGIHLWSLQENIDTSTAAGNLLFHVLAAFAQFDRETIVENTVAGLTAARARGRIGGRRQRWIDEKTRAKLYALRYLLYTMVPMAKICIALAISRATYYRYLGALETEPQQLIEKES